MKNRRKLIFICFSIATVSAGCGAVITACVMSEDMRKTGHLYTNVTANGIARSLAYNGVFISASQMKDITGKIDGGDNFKISYVSAACSTQYVPSLAECYRKYGLPAPLVVTK